MPITAETLMAVATVAVQEYKLDLFGTHGVGHWSRVYANGMRIADADTRIDRDVVTLFALLHDCCRIYDDHDPGHGERAADLVSDLYRNGALPITSEQVIDLEAAVNWHTSGHPAGTITAQACWDVDALDLPRCGGLVVDPNRLRTNAAQELVSWSRTRALAGEISGDVMQNWGIEIPRKVRPFIR